MGGEIAVVQVIEVGWDRKENQNILEQSGKCDLH